MFTYILLGLRAFLVYLECPSFIFCDLIAYSEFQNKIPNTF
jgi:hypothetical protein